MIPLRLGTVVLLFHLLLERVGGLGLGPVARAPPKRARALLLLRGGLQLLGVVDRQAPSRLGGVLLMVLFMVFVL